MITFLFQWKRKLPEFVFSLPVINLCRRSHFVVDGDTEQNNPASPIYHIRLLGYYSINDYLSNTRHTTRSLVANHPNWNMKMTIWIQPLKLNYTQERGAKQRSSHSCLIEHRTEAKGKCRYWNVLQSSSAKIESVGCLDVHHINLLGNK